LVSALKGWAASAAAIRSLHILYQPLEPQSSPCQQTQSHLQFPRVSFCDAGQPWPLQSVQSQTSPSLFWHRAPLWPAPHEHEQPTWSPSPDLIAVPPPLHQISSVHMSAGMVVHRSCLPCSTASRVHAQLQSPTSPDAAP
jgi:hypothetical protein